MSNKGMTITDMFVGAFAIILYVLAIMLIFTSHININIGLQISVEELKALPTFNKLISSKDCLSTGRIGILNKTTLDDVNGEDEMDCAYLPGIGYYVNVTDIENPRTWLFGFKGQSAEKYGKSRILIKYPDGEMHNGIITFYKSDEDPVVRLVYGADKAWMSSEPVSVYVGGTKKIKLKETEICYEDYNDPHHCKKLLNAKLDVGDGFVFNPDNNDYVEFSKTMENGNPMLSVESGKGTTKFVIRW